MASRSRNLATTEYDSHHPIPQFNCLNDVSQIEALPRYFAQVLLRSAPTSLSYRSTGAAMPGHHEKQKTTDPDASFESEPVAKSSRTDAQQRRHAERLDQFNSINSIISAGRLPQAEGWTDAAYCDAVQPIGLHGFGCWCSRTAN